MQASKRDADGHQKEAAEKGRLAISNEASTSDADKPSRPNALIKELLATWVFFHPDCLDRAVALLNEWFPGCNGFRGDHLPDAWKGWWRLDLAVVDRLKTALGQGPNNQYYIRVGITYILQLRFSMYLN